MASDGDIRVLLVLDLLLSLAFSTVVVWGLSFFDLASFTLRSVATTALALAVLTYLLVLR
ncbi:MULTISPECIES: hypothetical protein [Haloarcula]|uniref:DUF8107 domain-containing protein n=1 Tax=Haloarcula pellucida TaxID=1427151 RepID=A0A830GG31_9EURY|nr:MULTISPECIES: hypothetical protein [Halomicroarcula]MBX0346712.1 hypothetical protein [Halomicroarcula pellucida]MDS0277431.1 hypothetical protein [Halomicroarcula sp. S1AR25-4]GGN85151.1 hypothetical protein GCM10009030_01310 [Halomicroarcula pellucida]